MGAVHASRARSGVLHAAWEELTAPGAQEAEWGARAAVGTAASSFKAAAPRGRPGDRPRPGLERWAPHEHPLPSCPVRAGPRCRRGAPSQSSLGGGVLLWCKLQRSSPAPFQTVYRVGPNWSWLSELCWVPGGHQRCTRWKGSESSNHYPRGHCPPLPKRAILFTGKAPGGFLFGWFYILFI